MIGKRRKNKEGKVVEAMVLVCHAPWHNSGDQFYLSIPVKTYNLSTRQPRTIDSDIPIEGHYHMPVAECIEVTCKSLTSSPLPSPKV